MKKFNTTGVCITSKHYMADISEKAQEIKKLVDDGKYFMISRPRQYGKTTTLTALNLALADQYDVISIDFQDLTSTIFDNESKLTKGLTQLLCDTRDNMEIPVPDACYDRFQKLAGTGEKVKLNDIFRIFDSWCKENAKPVVLIIDEADTAANHQVFWEN
ncbi:MAG: AAA family ATPase [Succinimonas sp.]|nr:AAA family ATPase [Succinimonas sp.]